MVISERTRKKIELEYGSIFGFNKEKTMKKLIIMILFLFTFYVASSPSLSIIQNEDIIKRITMKWEYEQEYMRFINHLGYRESNNDWTITNKINCLGEWQFSYNTLKVLGYKDITPDKFKKDPTIFPRDLQLKVLKELIELNTEYLNPYKNYIGKIIKGVKITKSGLLGGMHLGGIVCIKLYLTSNGVIDRADLNGTKISDYIKEFGIYNL